MFKLRFSAVMIPKELEALFSKSLDTEAKAAEFVSTALNSAIDSKYGDVVDIEIVDIKIEE